MLGFTVQPEMKNEPRLHRRFFSASVTVGLAVAFVFFLVPQGPVEAKVTITPENGSIIQLGTEIKAIFDWVDAPGDTVKGHVCIKSSSLVVKDTIPYGECTPYLMRSAAPETRPAGQTVGVFTLSRILTQEDVNKTGCVLSATQTQCVLKLEFFVCDQTGIGGCYQTTSPIDADPIEYKVQFGENPSTPDITISMQEDTGQDPAVPVLIPFSGTDSVTPSELLIYTIVDFPEHGDIIYTGTKPTHYLPDPEYHGPDTFTFTATDSDGNVSTPKATATISITSVNDAPRLSSGCVNFVSGTCQLSTTPSVVAGSPLNFTVKWLEVEGDSVKIHICRTPFINNTTTGGNCRTTAETIVSTTVYLNSVPIPPPPATPTVNVSTITPAPNASGADANTNVTYYIFICDNGPPTPKCSNSPAADKGEFRVLPGSFELKVDKTGDGLGFGNIKETPTPNIDCGLVCKFNYAGGSDITLEATPTNPAIATFVKWTGACTGTNPTCQINDIDADKLATAEFVLQNVTLAIQKTGTGTVTAIGLAGPFMTCDPTCTTSIGANANIALEADLNVTDGWHFDSWSNCTQSGGTIPVASPNKCQLLMNGNKTIRAVFIQDSYALQLTVGGPGKITEGANLNCGDNQTLTQCTQTYLSTTSVILTAVYDPSTVIFNGWGAQCNSNPTPTTCEVVMTGAKNILVNFDVVTFELKIDMRSGASDSQFHIENTTEGWDFFASGNFVHSYFANAGSSVRLTITANGTQKVFQSWGDACSGSNTVCSPDPLIMNGVKTAVANFSGTRQLKITRFGQGSGSVAVTVAGPGGFTYNCDNAALTNPDGVPGNDCVRNDIPDGRMVSVTITGAAGSATRALNCPIASGSGNVCGFTITADFWLAVEFNAAPTANAMTVGVCEFSSGGPKSCAGASHPTGGPIVLDIVKPESADYLTCAILSQPPASAGSVTITKGTGAFDSTCEVQFTPVANFTGPTSFTYSVFDHDNNGAYHSPASAVVSVDVLNVNDPPVADAKCTITPPGGSPLASCGTAVSGTTKSLALFGSGTTAGVDTSENPSSYMYQWTCTGCPAGMPISLSGMNPAPFNLPSSIPSPIAKRAGVDFESQQFSPPAGTFDTSTPNISNKEGNLNYQHPGAGNNSDVLLVFVSVYGDVTINSVCFGTCPGSGLPLFRMNPATGSYVVNGTQTFNRRIEVWYRKDVSDIPLTNKIVVNYAPNTQAIQVSAMSLIDVDTSVLPNANYSNPTMGNTASPNTGNAAPYRATLASGSIPLNGIVIGAATNRYAQDNSATPYSTSVETTTVLMQQNIRNMTGGSGTLASAIGTTTSTTASFSPGLSGTNTSVIVFSLPPFPGSSISVTYTLTATDGGGLSNSAAVPITLSP